MLTLSRAGWATASLSSSVTSSNGAFVADKFLGDGGSTTTAEDVSDAILMSPEQSSCREQIGNGQISISAKERGAGSIRGYLPSILKSNEFYLNGRCLLLSGVNFQLHGSDVILIEINRRLCNDDLNLGFSFHCRR